MRAERVRGAHGLHVHIRRRVCSRTSTWQTVLTSTLGRASLDGSVTRRCRGGAREACGPTDFELRMRPVGEYPHVPHMHAACGPDRWLCLARSTEVRLKFSIDLVSFSLEAFIAPPVAFAHFG